MNLEIQKFTPFGQDKDFFVLRIGRFYDAPGDSEIREHIVYRCQLKSYPAS
jgi:hypothetical protein